MKMPRDIKESLEMLLITKTGGEEGPERCGGCCQLPLAGPVRLGWQAHRELSVVLNIKKKFFFFFFCSYPAQPSEICAIVWQRVRNIVYTAKVSSQSPTPITSSRSTL